MTARVPGFAVSGGVFYTIVCAGSNVCKANYQCPGGSTCGTNCNPGYTNNGTDCIRTPCARRRSSNEQLNNAHQASSFAALPTAAVETKIVSVQSAQPTATCLGTQVGRFATTQSDLVALGSCNNQCQLGPASSNAFCGTSLGVPTYCCYRPAMAWAATGASVTAYPYISVPFGVRPSR